MMTMYLAADALEGFDVDVEITDGEAKLSGLRIGRDVPKDCLAVFDEDGRVICSHANDRIIVSGAADDEVANALLGYFDAIDEWEKQLLAVKPDDPVQRFIDLSAPIFRNPILLTDTNSMTSAISNEPAGTVNVEWDHIIEFGRMSWRWTDLFFSDPAARKAMSVFLKPVLYKPPELPDQAINCHIPDASGKHLLATFVVIGKRPITPGMMQLALIASQAIYRWLLSHGDESGLFSQIDFLASLARGEHADEDEMEWQKQRMRYGDEAFVLIRAIYPEMYAVPWAASTLERRIERCRAFESDGWVYALCPATASLRETLVQIASEFEMRFGLSWPFRDWNSLSIAAEQTEVALAYSPGAVAQLDSRCSMEYMLTMLGSAANMESVEHPAVQALAAYDSKHGTDLLHTLWVYLRLERNQVATAAALGLHRNSLLYRVGRIEQLIAPVDLGDPDAREHLMLSMRLFRLEHDGDAAR